MAKHLQRDLDNLRRELLTIGAIVEDAIQTSITATVDRDPDAAEVVIQGDQVIDEKEVAIENECMKILALHQPVAADLRFVVAVLKVNNDLERMGDLAANIAKRARALSHHDSLGSAANLREMGQIVGQMVRQSLDALVRSDTALALAVCATDEKVDGWNKQMYDSLRDLMHADVGNVDRCIHTLTISRALERIADLATNIAEDVVFMVEGEIVRHGLGRGFGDA